MNRRNILQTLLCLPFLGINTKPKQVVVAWPATHALGDVVSFSVVTELPFDSGGLFWGLWCESSNCRVIKFPSRTVVTVKTTLCELCYECLDFPLKSHEKLLLNRSAFINQIPNKNVNSLSIEDVVYYDGYKFMLSSISGVVHESC